MNGLPVPSTALGLSSEIRPIDPTEKYWLAPVLHVLASKAYYRPGIFIADTDALWDEVVVAAGFDTSNPDALPRPLDRKRKGKGRKQGLYSLAYYAAFYARGDIARPAPVPLVVKQGKSWALTEAGIAVAANLHSEFSERKIRKNAQGEEIEVEARNVTNVWLDGQIQFHGLHKRLLNAITYDPTTRKERESGEVDDHVDHFLASRIHNNSFATRLGTCDPPTFREIKTYTLRATYTTFKRRAQDPLHREGRGALTDSERKAGGPTTASMVSSEYSKVLQTTECLRSEGTVMSEVIVDNAQVARDMHRLDFDRGMNKVREAFRRFKPGNHDRMYRVFNLMAEGHTVEQIGEHEGVTRNRAATLMADTRGALRAARQATTDAITVLQYIVENPCSTLPDLEEDLEVSTSLPVLLTGLVANGRLESKEFDVRGTKGTITGYIVTDSGDHFVAERVSSNASSDGIIESLSL
jgi:hypothetical protein